MEEDPLIATPARRRLLGIGKYGLGVLLLLAVVVIWVGSAVLIQLIFSADNFNKPFFLTYFDTTLVRCVR